MDKKDLPAVKDQLQREPNQHQHERNQHQQERNHQQHERNQHKPQRERQNKRDDDINNLDNFPPLSRNEDKRDNPRRGGRGGNNQGGYDQSRGGNDQSRGGYDQGRGGYDQSRGGNDQGRGGRGFNGGSLGRGGGGRGRGGYEDRRRQNKYMDRKINENNDRKFKVNIIDIFTFYLRRRDACFFVISQISFKHIFKKSDT